MRNWTLKLGLMMLTLITLTACPDKKGGGAVAAPPAANGGCTIGSDGLCVGGSIYAGYGRWSGDMNVHPDKFDLYIQFLRENGLCHGRRSCRRLSEVVRVAVTMNNERASLKIIPYDQRHGRAREYFKSRATSYVINGGNGFQVVTRGQGRYQIQIYPQPIQQEAVQLVGLFTAPQGQVVTTTLHYRGVVFASGVLHGQRFDYPIGY